MSAPSRATAKPALEIATSRQARRGEADAPSASRALEGCSAWTQCGERFTILPAGADDTVVRAILATVLLAALLSASALGTASAKRPASRRRTLRAARAPASLKPLERRLRRLETWRTRRARVGPRWSRRSRRSSGRSPDQRMCHRHARRRSRAPDDRADLHTMPRSCTGSPPVNGSGGNAGDRRGDLYERARCARKVTVLANSADHQLHRAASAARCMPKKGRWRALRDPADAGRGSALSCASAAGQCPGSRSRSPTSSSAAPRTRSRSPAERPSPAPFWSRARERHPGDPQGSPARAGGAAIRHPSRMPPKASAS